MTPEYTHEQVSALLLKLTQYYETAMVVNDISKEQIINIHYYVMQQQASDILRAEPGEIPGLLPEE